MLCRLRLRREICPLPSITHLISAIDRGEGGAPQIYTGDSRAQEEAGLQPRREWPGVLTEKPNLHGGWAATARSLDRKAGVSTSPLLS